MKKNIKQYTIRGISESLDKQLKKLAQKKNKSLNAWFLELLTRHVGLESEETTYHDLDHLAGKWVEDKEILKALAEQRQINEDLWK